MIKLIIVVLICITQYDAKPHSKNNPYIINNNANMAISTIGLFSWYPYYANLQINEACPYNNIQQCSINFNPFTLSPCQILTYFNRPVCGGQSCFFNQTSQKCDGQCSNPILQTCVSKSDTPRVDGDCVCASSSTNPSIWSNFSLGYYQYLPSCDASTCYGNSCSFFYVSINRISNGTLYARCNNDMPINFNYY